MPGISQPQVAVTDYILYGAFETMDTQSAREALPTNRLAWCENLQIVGPNQLAACNSPIPPITSIPGETITNAYFANFTPPGGTLTDFIICFCQSGAAYQVNAATGATTKFALAGTFSAAPDMTIWSSQRILMADPTAGYCSWDGHSFVQQGGVSPNIVVTNGGSGYASPPTVTITGGSGTGATAHAVLTGGVVTSVVLDNAGTGYKAGDVLTVTFGSGTAAATAIVWPFLAFSPTTLAVYAGRVWLAGARQLFWTGTKGYDDAASADASGSTSVTDADLAHAITALRNFNNFLYIFGDASIKQIGTITVSGSVTIFNIVTLSSDQGTPFPRAIASYNRLVLFANKVGVYAILGASVEKVSDQMDGIFASLDYSQPFQSAVQDLHTSLHTFLLLVRYRDPYAGVTRSLIMCFYKNRWFVANQGSNLLTICTAPIGGIVETFASSGSDVTQLFQGTTPVPFILRTALSAHNKPHVGKAGHRGVLMLSSTTLTTLQGSADSENRDPGLPFTFNTAIPIQWINNSLQSITWINNANEVVNWAATGFLYQRFKIDSRGVFLGLTVTGTVAGASGGSNTGFIINGLLVEYEEVTVLASRMQA